VFELEAHEAGGPVWLVVGLRHFDLTQPYTRRLVAHAAAHPGTRLDIAVSRDTTPSAGGLPPNVHLHGHARVQDVLQAEHARFDRHLRDGGNTVVMGHTRMGAEVQAWLRGRFVAAGLAADAAAATAMQAQFEATLRVQYSLSGR
jgi:sulfite reductase alpha subunit-like flavoprotein